MQIALPQIIAPLDAMAVCIHIPLDAHAELLPLFTEQVQRLEARSEEGADPRYLRLLMERAANGRGHFHIDAVRQRVFRGTPPPARASSAEIQKKYDAIVGKLLKVVFQSRFEVSPASLPKSSVVNLVAGVEIDFDGAIGSLTAATVRISDSVASEIRWKLVRRNGTPFFVIEILQAKEMLIGENLLLDAECHLTDAFNKYVAVKRPQDVRAEA
jgi:hypothetical protein